MLVKLTQGYFISMNDYRKSHTIVLFAVFFDKEYKKNSNSHMPSYVQLNPQAVFYTAFQSSLNYCAIELVATFRCVIVQDTRKSNFSSKFFVQNTSEKQQLIKVLVRHDIFAYNIAIKRRFVKRIFCFCFSKSFQTTGIQYDRFLYKLQVSIDIGGT